MFRVHMGKTKAEPGFECERRLAFCHSCLRDWKSEDIERVEALAGDLLGEMGHPGLSLTVGRNGWRSPLGCVRH